MLVKPFGFLGAQGGGWDPTVGGTLTVEHHWDWTDSDTMTLSVTGNGASASGSFVANITDKVGGEVMHPVNGPTGNALKITTTGSYNETLGATYLSGSPYQVSDNWLPATLNTATDWSVVMIMGSEDWTRYATNQQRAFWYARSNETNGYDNLLAFMKRGGWLGTSTCTGSGVNEVGMAIYDGGGWGTPVSRDYTDTEVDTMADPDVYQYSYDQANTQYNFTRNGEDKCNFTRSATPTANGEGLCIGGGPIGLNEKNCFEGMIYQFVVYSQQLNQDQMDSINSSWVSFRS